MSSLLDRVLCRRRSNRAVLWMIAAWLGAPCLDGARADEGRSRLAAAPQAAAALSESAAAFDPAASADALQERIEQLIRQLGSPQYTVRRSAANELRRIGPEAFDLLHVATDDPDPEVAAAALYLLRQVTVRWVHSDDSPTLRRMLRNYGEQANDLRLRSVEQLAQLADADGIAALCRIARFDRSPLVARMAALAVIRSGEPSAASPQVEPQTIERELGPSTRVPAAWLRQFVLQHGDPRAAVPRWEMLIEQELVRLHERADETSSEVVAGLLWNLAELNLRLGDTAAVLAAVDRMVDLDPESLESIAIELMAWLIEHQSWDVLEEFLDRHQPQLQHSKRPLYHAALARRQQGKPELAEELARRAAALDSHGTLESFIAAREMEERSRFEWAVREYRRTIDNQPVASHEGLLARVYLASMLHDYEHDREAADVLQPLVLAVEGNEDAGQLYRNLLRHYQGRLYLPETKTLAARYHYYLACQHRAEQDPQRQQQALELAIGFDPSDADILIAMYRVAEADETWHAAVRKRIAELARQFQQEIDEQPSRAMHYNQWAWLISNTEGDYQKAIRYSHRSLELNTNGDSAAASYLDTLGRCYYAVGDYENAVKYQRQAVEKVDYLQVMHRQLALFEAALAEQQEAESSQ